MPYILYLMQVPWPRAYTLDSIIRHTIDKLWKESKTDPTSEAASLQLSDKLRLDEWGRLIEGQGDKRELGIVMQDVGY
jgi:hypothetical protein